MCNENQNFKPKPVAEFLDGNHHFYIPSYQRGYRWEEKQVKDLLKDICDFAEKETGTSYYLQPIVVKENPLNKKQWIVIDGQQRLTTILLILKHLRKISEDAKTSPAELYDITYQTRNMNFDNIIATDDIDSFFAHSALQIIIEWFQKYKGKKSRVVEVLFDTYPKDSNKPQVKFIWYVVENDDEIESIKIFNNLNKGKIRLTNAELIKALFILKSKEEGLDEKALAYEWNEMENQLHDDRFWYFLANKNYNPATRIDIIFDFLTLKKIDEKEDDYSYREFQKLYDKEQDALWKCFSQAWDKVKETYQTFRYWYEDHVIYHYIGYLICRGETIQNIYKQCKDKSKTKVVAELRKMISDIEKKKVNIPEDIEALTYDDNKDEVRNLLLLFNIETCAKQTNSDYRFSFDKYKNNNWDIEHVDSQTKNDLTKVKDKIIWLKYLECVNFSYPNDEDKQNKWDTLKQDGSALLEELEKKKEDKGLEFDEFYKKIAIFCSEEITENDKDNDISDKGENKIIDFKNTIRNLTLLDSGTNRGYGNALFPTKRQEIIKRGQTGIFIPICTKNLFMKYYTKDDTKISQWNKNTWAKDDAKDYLRAIHETIDWIFNI